MRANGNVTVRREVRNKAKVKKQRSTTSTRQGPERFNRRVVRNKPGSGTEFGKNAIAMKKLDLKRKKSNHLRTSNSRRSL